MLIFYHAMDVLCCFQWCYGELMWMFYRATTHGPESSFKHTSKHRNLPIFWPSIYIDIPSFGDESCHSTATENVVSTTPQVIRRSQVTGPCPVDHHPIGCGRWTRWTMRLANGVSNQSENHRLENLKPFLNHTLRQ